MTPRRVWIPVFVAGLLVGGARAAAIDDRGGEARQHYQAATRLFNLGDFDRAIDEYRAAYALEPRPALLFNIAQAYRAKRDDERALYFYGAYLREDPHGDERAFVEARMAELRKEMSRRPTPRPDTGAPLRTAGAWTMGGGLVLIGGGLFSGVQALGAMSDGNAGGAHGAQKRALWLTAAGAAAVVGGGVMYWIGNRERPVAVGASAHGGGGGVWMAVGF